MAEIHICLLWISGVPLSPGHGLCFRAVAGSHVSCWGEAHWSSVLYTRCCAGKGSVVHAYKLSHAGMVGIPSCYLVLLFHVWNSYGPLECRQGVYSANGDRWCVLFYVFNVLLKHWVHSFLVLFNVKNVGYVYHPCPNFRISFFLFPEELQKSRAIWILYVWHGGRYLSIWVVKARVFFCSPWCI